MKINTSYHGLIDIDQKEVLHFEQSIPGFPNETQFIRLPLEDNPIFEVLQSIQTPELSFVISNPFHFFKDYDFYLEKSTLAQLGLTREEEVLVFSILTIQNPFEQSTANLQAPIIINSKNNKAKQVILNDTPYQTKHLFVTPQTEATKG
ncbi:flagellar assembly protein FliW [Bacillus sp. RO3]|nr:flagellar assembly protein FliW [Bacillus sp. RO3]